MNKLTTLPILLMPILLLTGITSIGIAYASQPTTIIGSFTTSAAAPYNLRTAGGNTFLNYDTTFSFTGPFSGDIDVVGGDWVVHSNGKGNAYHIGTFSGTVDGIPGTLVIRSVSTINQDGTYQGSAVTLSGTGGLTNIHLTMTFEGILGIGGTYSANYHFDP